MADTSDLEAAFEWTRGELSRRFGVSFSKRGARLRQGTTRTFNAVAEDGSIVAQISHASGPTKPKGNKPSAKIKAAVASLYFLSQAQAKRRILVLTDSALHPFVLAEVEGALAEDLEIIHIELPRELAETVREVTDRASDEMT